MNASDPGAAVDPAAKPTLGGHAVRENELAYGASPTDVDDACLFLASPLARFFSGATLLLHGGGEKPAFLAAAKPGGA